MVLIINLVPINAIAQSETVHKHSESCYASAGDLLCKIPESEGHAHSEGCYCPGGELICGQEESEGHTHTDSCYEISKDLICTEPETEGHQHSEGCYSEDGALICGQEESQGHIHTDNCYETTTKLICTEVETGTHQHSEECYCSGGELTCGLEESEGHTHNEDCFAKGGELICGLEVAKEEDIATSLPPTDLVITSEIESFEESNPVETLTYKTDDTVSQADFPTSLHAVVKLGKTVERFTQEKPDTIGHYIAPENAEALYDQGTIVVYTFYKNSTTEYRVYGTADGVTGWFVCNEQGETLSAVVKEIPITWDITGIDTSISGEYTVVGSVAEEYTLTCDVPQVNVIVKAKSGDTTIASHSIKWISGSNETTIDGDNLSITPKQNAENNSYVTCQISFSMGGEENLAPYAAEIRIPQHIFYDRNGKPTGIAKVPLAEYPAAEGTTGFNYRIDEKTDEIVISNYQEIASSYVFVCQVAYYFTPFQVKNGYSNDQIAASFKVVGKNGDTVSATSEHINIKVQTEIIAPRVEKVFCEKYERWNEKSWGTPIENAEDYFFVKWEIKYIYFPGTQPSHLTYKEKVGEGILFGWGIREWGGTQRGTLEDFEKTWIRDYAVWDKVTKPYYDSTYVYIAYPRTMLADSKEIYNTCTAVVTGLDDGVKEVESSAKYTYQPVNFNYEGDLISLSKWFSGLERVHFFDYDLPSKMSFEIDINARGYGNTHEGKDPYTVYLEDNLIFLEGEQLQPTDYQYTKLGFGNTDYLEYDAILDPNKGMIQEVNTNFSSYQPLEVYIKTTSNPNWTYYGKAQKTSVVDIIWIDANGVENNNFYGIALPEGTYDISIRHTSAKYAVKYRSIVTGEIKPTDHVKALAANKRQIDLTNVSSGFMKDKDGRINLGNKVPPLTDSSINKIVSESDQEKYGQIVCHAWREGTLNRLKGESYMYKRATEPVSDPLNQQEKVTYTLTQYEQALYDTNRLTPEDILDFHVITEQREGIFYDLLPIGSLVDEESITAKTYKQDDSQMEQKECEFTVEFKTNWRGSNRTMMIIHVKAPEGKRNYDYSDSFGKKVGTGFEVTFDLLEPWDVLLDYGTTVLNSAAYYSLSGNLTKGRADDGGDISESNWFKDLDGDGNTDAAKKNVMYEEHETTFNPLIAAELGFRKSVKADTDLTYSNTQAQVTPGETYTYKLRFANSESVKTSDVIMFDVLESAYSNHPYWQGTLKSIDVSQTEIKGIKPVIYYSTATDFGNLSTDKIYTDLTDTSRWSKIPPTNLKDVTAIAVDLRYKADGSKFVFEPRESALCCITMTAPDSAKGYIDHPGTPEDETVYAYNSAYLQSESIALDGITSTEKTEECSSVKVSLKAPSKGNLTVSKTVSGNGVDTTQAFSFTVTLNDETINGAYGEMIFEKGVSNFELKAGESKTGTGLPADVKYSVVENDNSGYQVTITGEADGFIIGGEDTTVIFNNHKELIDPTDPEKPVDPVDPEKPVNPTDPEKPVNPTDPEKPVNPVDPPTTPDKSTNPDYPTTPDRATNPDHLIKPEKPTSSGNPENPDYPNKPNESVDSNQAADSDKLIPETGDNDNIGTVAAVMVLSFVGLVFLVVDGTKKRNNEQNIR